MEVITREQALARAYEIAESDPPTPIDFCGYAVFRRRLTKYFPEFKKCSHLISASRLYGKQGVQDFFNKDFSGGFGSVEFVFNIESAADHRHELYAHEFSRCGSAVSNELFEVLSFGADASTDGRELRETCWDLACIWTGFRQNWCLEIGKMKTGQETDLIDWAREAGVDLSVEAYFSGVSVEHLVVDGAFKPSTWL